MFEITTVKDESRFQRLVYRLSKMLHPNRGAMVAATWTELAHKSNLKMQSAKLGLGNGRLDTRNERGSHLQDKR